MSAPKKPELIDVARIEHSYRVGRVVGFTWGCIFCGAAYSLIKAFL